MNESTQETQLADAQVRRQSRRMTRRSLLTGAALVAGGFTAWNRLRHAGLEDGISWPLRKVLQFNERLATAFFRDTRLAPTYARSLAAPRPRVNGSIGLGGEVDPAAWRLRVEEAGGRHLSFSLNDLTKLPRTEIVTELNCVEGWQEIVHWGGIPLHDFAARHGFGTRSGAALDPQHHGADLWPYVSLATPDRSYYVGLDIAGALHPQTLLCWEMNGERLTAGHGAPLRLVIPVKYGIKNIKRIGIIRFQNERPTDYWAERGYDWFAGL